MKKHSASATILLVSLALASCGDQVSTTQPTDTPTITATISDNSLIANLSWNVTSSTGYYEIYKHTENQLFAATQLVSRENTIHTNYNDKLLQPGTTYYYWLRFCNSAGCSGFSQIEALTTPPSMPTLIRNSRGSSTSLSWEDVLGASHYEAYRSVQDQTSSLCLLVPSPENTPADTSVDADTTYNYQLKACNSGGCSGLSQAVSLNALLCPQATDDHQLKTCQQSECLEAATPTAIPSQLSGLSDPSDPSELSGLSELPDPTDISELSGLPELPDPTDISELSGLPEPSDTSSIPDPFESSKGSEPADSSEPFGSPGFSSTPSPSTPSLTHSVKGAKVTLFWGDISGASHYELYSYVEGQKSNVSKLASPKTTSFVDIETENGTTYSYLLKACNKNQCSPYSEVLTLTTAPSAPLLTASVKGSSVLLVWKHLPSASHYQIYRSAKKQALHANKLASSKTTSYRDATVNSNTNYHYWLSACNSAGCSELSEVVTLTTVPSVPVLTGSIKEINALLSWKGRLRASYYELYLYLEGQASKIRKIASPKATKFTDTKLHPNTQHHYQLKACNSSGCSDFSQVLTLALPPSVPVLTGKFNGLTANLFWKDIQGASHYEIYESTKNQISRAVHWKPEKIAHSRYSNTVAQHGTNYYYWLKACNSGLCSDFSQVVALTTAPSRPALIGKLDGSTAHFSWKYSLGASYYKIYKNTKDPEFSRALKLQPERIIGAVYSDSPISNGVTSHYWLKACNSSGCSQFSQPVTLTTTPSSPSVTAHINKVGASLSWKEIPGTSYYEIHKTTKGKAAAIHKVDASKTTQYTDTQIDSGTTYNYQMRACNSHGCSELSQSVSLKTVPSQPQLNSSLNDVTVNLSWNNLLGVSYYEVYKNTNPDQSSATQLKPKKIVSSSYSDTVTQSGTVYCYWLRACNNSGCSDFSKAAVLTTVPSMPSLTASVNDRSASLSWKEIPSASYYEVHKETKDQETTIHKVDVLTTSYIDTQLNSGTTYNYQLKACNGGGCSESHQLVSLTTTPSTPSLFVSLQGVHAVLAWDNLESVSYYEVYTNTKAQRLNTSQTKPTKIQSSPSYSAKTGLGDAPAMMRAPQYSNTLVHDGTSHYYWLRACNNSGCSDFSQAASLETIPSAPVLAGSINGPNVLLSWVATANTSHFQIYRDTHNRPFTTTFLDSTILAAGTSYHDFISAGINYYYRLKACNSSGCSNASNVIPLQHTKNIPLNDTGITSSTRCDTHTNTPNDCNQGRDIQATSGALQKIGAGSDGFDFTKIDSNGDPLALQSAQWSDIGSEDTGTNWSCVRDNLTGLVWEVKVATGMADSTVDIQRNISSNIHHKGNLYRWGGITAMGKNHSLANTKIYAEDWNTLVNGANHSSFCGHQDWRAPSFTELQSIVDYNSSYRTIDTHYFPNTLSVYLSSLAHDQNAWSIDFTTGGTSSYLRYAGHLRLVRGEQPVHNSAYAPVNAIGNQTLYPHTVNEWPDSRYIEEDRGADTLIKDSYIEEDRGADTLIKDSYIEEDRGADTMIKDSNTGLMWKPCPEGQSGVSCTDDGTSKSFSWTKALEHANNHLFATYNDWRVPNIKELSSLAAMDRNKPAINSKQFPNTASTPFWSSSISQPHLHKHAWQVTFERGDIAQVPHSSTNSLRLVRGGY